MHLAVDIKNMPIEEAKKTGAQALFGEKYGDIVRVVNMGGFLHRVLRWYACKNTPVRLWRSRLFQRAGVAAGVRRIEALTSKGLH